jgi:hypothetical protein
MKAIQIEAKVGRCDSCRKFRNNMEWKVEDKVVCLDCFKMFRNQRLIDEVIKKVEIKPTKTVRKVKTVKEVNQERPKREAVNYRIRVLNHLKNTDRPLSVKEMYSDRLASKVTIERWLRVLVKSGEVATMRSTAKAYYINKDREHLLKEYISGLRIQKKIKLKDIVLKIIKSSPIPLTPLEINVAGDWHNKSVYPVLKKLLNENKIVCHKVSESVRLYIDVKRIDLLTQNTRCFEAGELGSTKAKILDFIYKSNKVLALSDITKGLSIHRSTSLRLCRELERQGIVKLGKGSLRCEATLVAPTNNESLLMELDSRIYNSTENKLMRFMKAGNAATLREIYKAVGCGKGKTSTRNYVQKLLSQWRCEVGDRDGVPTYCLRLTPYKL